MPSTGDRARKDMAIACRLVFLPVMARMRCTSNSLSIGGHHAPFINAAQYASANSYRQDICANILHEMQNICGGNTTQVEFGHGKKEATASTDGRLAGQDSHG